MADKFKRTGRITVDGRTASLITIDGPVSSGFWKKSTTEVMKSIISDFGRKCMLDPCFTSPRLA
jgi:hypothetical protein